jgi:peptidoglycan/xylan/chitin deacetylase (PgdA/CDA1 family)
MIRRRLRHLLPRFDTRPKPVILMYHRIATPAVDPWGLCVSPERLEAQLLRLRRERTLVGMDDFARGLASGDLPPTAVAITFDDGYRDNLTKAKPILERVGAPATVFITTGRIGRAAEFWWDELARIVLLRPEPLDCELTLAGASHRVTLSAARGRRPSRRWRAWVRGRTDRETAYRDLWSHLQRSDPAEREAAMARLRDCAALPPAECDALPLTEEEVRALASPLISIGAHGCTHQPLTALPRAERAAEIQGSGEACEKLVATAPSGFAYPHGDQDPETRQLVQEAGYSWACSTESAAARPGQSDLFNLPRIMVENWSAGQLMRVLRAAA